MKKIFSFFTLLIFIIIGFFHNSMMAFAMQSGMHNEMMGEMEMKCCTKENDNNGGNKKSCDEKYSCCVLTDVDDKIFSLNNHFNKKILKVKFFSFVDIFSESAKFLENKNLIKNTSPPSLEKRIKYYSYSDLVKIVKSNT